MKLNYILGLGIVLSLVGISLLFSFGFLYLKPYLSVVNFQEAVCKTVSIWRSEQIVVQCQCAADGRSQCVSEYPCYLVRVNFTAVENVGDFATNVILYDSFETYYLFETYIPQNDTKRQCSYHKCNREMSDNHNSVNQFRKRLSTNTSYQCFYDPNDRNFALVDVVVLSTVINCLFWPALAFIIGMIIFFVEVFHVDKKKVTTQRNQFSSLERQWARIRERSYGRMTSAGSERLVQGDNLEGTSHNVVCLQP